MGIVASPPSLIPFTIVEEDEGMLTLEGIAMVGGLVLLVGALFLWETRLLAPLAFELSSWPFSTFQVSQNKASLVEPL